jgi:protein gp37
MDLSWLENIVARCRVRNIAAWVKQDSAPRPGTQGRISDAWCLKEFPQGV